MSPFDYYIERGAKVLEVNSGFGIYWITKDECYLEIVYVDPEARKDDVANTITRSIERIAKERSCKYFTTTVNLNKGDPNISAIAILKYGFKILSADSDAIYFSKELSNG